MKFHRISLKNTYLLIRHGEALSNETNTLISSMQLSDRSPITEQGFQQIDHLCSIISSEKITRIVSSDFLRTLQTATCISNHVGVKVDIDMRLRERYLGDFDGKSIQDMQDKVSLDDLQWDSCLYNMEPYCEVFNRVIACWQDMENQYQGEVIALISHNSPLRILSAWMVGLRGSELSPRSNIDQTDINLGNAEVLKITERIEKKVLDKNPSRASIEA